MSDDWTPNTPFGWKLSRPPAAKDYGFRFAGESVEGDRPLVFELRQVRPTAEPLHLDRLIGVVDGGERFNAPPGAVVFEGYTVEAVRQRDGSHRWVTTATLACRRPSWNHARRPDGGFAYMTDANGQPPYVPADVFDQMERAAVG